MWWGPDMKMIAALLLGVLFAVGLGVSGMTRPEIVQGFLDFAGAWNPALMFVMCSAIPVFLAWLYASWSVILVGALLVAELPNSSRG